MVDSVFPNSLSRSGESVGVMDRRSLLKRVAAVSFVGSLAGCAGGSGGLSPPPADANPKNLLPETPDGWRKTQGQEQAAGMVEAEAGYSGGYRDRSGAYYGVEILRWSSNSDAKEKGQEVYSSGWPIFVVIGNFGIAGKGADVGKLVMLLSNSSALSRDYIVNNNLNGELDLTAIPESTPTDSEASTDSTTPEETPTENIETPTPEAEETPEPLPESKGQVSVESAEIKEALTLDDGFRVSFSVTPSEVPSYVEYKVEITDLSDVVGSKSGRIEMSQYVVTASKSVEIAVDNVDTDMAYLAKLYINGEKKAEDYTHSSR